MDVVSMLILTMIVFGMTYFVLHSIRKKRAKEWEQVVLMSDAGGTPYPPESESHPNLLCVKCDATFEIEEIIEQPGEMVCPACGSKDTIVWLPGSAPLETEEATLEEERELATKEESRSEEPMVWLPPF
jgi:hypothetical protein